MVKLKRSDNFDQHFKSAHSTLRKQIISGQLKPGDYLISENKLSEKFSISRPSIRKVISLLEQEGLVSTRRGKGTCVSDSLNFKTDQTENLQVGVFIPTYENCLQDIDIKGFESIHPLVKVQLHKIPDENYHTMIDNLVHAEEPLDLVFIMDWHFQDFIHDDWMADLTPFIQSSDLFENLETDYYFKLFEKYQIAKQQAAIPFAFSPVALAYNCDLFDRERISYPDNSWDWERFLETAKLMTHDWNGDGVFEQFGFGLSAHRHRWPGFVYRNNGKFIDLQTGASAMTAPETVEAVEFISNLLHRHQVAPMCVAEKTIDPHLLFARSKIAMTLVSYFSFNFVFTGLPFRWDIAACPGKPDAPHLMLSTAFIMNKHTPNPEIAWQFIEFFMSKKIQDGLRLRNSVIPIRKASSLLRVEPSSEIDPFNYNFFTEALENFDYISAFNSTQASQPVWEEMSLVWANLQSPVQACKLIERKINLQLASNHNSLIK